MVIKINYTSSDIYVSTNVSPVYVVVNYSAVNNGGGGAIWGGITGTLSDQTDLQDALDAKFDDPTGTASQYIRGDGQLANFPTNQGGGSSVNYYLNGSVNQGTFGGDTYYEMSKTPIIGSGTNFTRTNAQGNGYIASFITDAGDPALLNIPGGNWNLEFYFAASSSGSTPSFYAELYKVSSANVFTLIASGSTNPEGITNGTVVDQYFTSIPVPQTALLATDRIAIRIFVTPSGRTITLHTEDNNLCEVLTTLSTGLNALNGLTAQVQYFATGTSGTDFAISSATDTHTFNLPTASGTNRGALSSADWTTFSGKVGGTGASGQVAYWNGTNSQTGSNNLFWDAANARLGIGTNAPTRTLDIIGTFRANNASGYGFDVGSSGQTTINTASGSTGLTISDTANAIFRLSASTYAFRFVLLGSSQRLELRDVNQSDAVRLAVSNAGNTSLGSSIDGGQRLQVYGDAFIKGSGATNATTALTLQNSSGNNTFRVFNAGSVGFGNTGTLSTIAPMVRAGGGPDVAGDSLLFFASGQGAGQDYLFSGSSITSTTGTIISVNLIRGFLPTSGNASYGVLQIGSQINQSGGANGITRGLYVNPTLTAAADWRSIEWSNNSGWGLYGVGSAPNLLSGVTTIRTNASSNEVPLLVQNYQTLSGFKTVSIDLVAVNGDARITAGNQNTGSGANGFLTFSTRTAEALTEKLRIDSAGKLLIGTTSADANSLVNINGAVRCVNDFRSFVNGSDSTYQGGFYQQTTSGTQYAFLQQLGSTGQIRWWTYNPTNLFVNHMTLTNAGRLLLGLTAEGTFLLDVNGTARVSGLITASSGVFSQARITATQLSSDSGGVYYTRAFGHFTTPALVIQTSTGGNASTDLSMCSFSDSNGFGDIATRTGNYLSITSERNPGSSEVGFTGTINFINLTTDAGGSKLTNSSTGRYNAINIGYRINRTGAGIMRGFYYNPIVDNLGGSVHNAIETTSGNIIFNNSNCVVNSSSINASAVLQADSTTKGFLPPRMTTTQKNAIGTPAAGLQVYDTTLNQMSYYNGTTWVNF